MAKKEPGRERHHRHPKSRASTYKGSVHEDRNISLLRTDYHRAYHLLFGNLMPDDIAKLLSDVYISPDFYLIAVPRKRPSNKRRRKKMYCHTCSSLVLQHLPVTCGNNCKAP